MFVFDDPDVQPGGDHLLINTNTNMNSQHHWYSTCALLIHYNYEMFRLIAIFSLFAVGLSASPGGDPKQAQILRSESDISPEGSYQFAYETDNGISAQEQGNIQPQGPEQAIKSVSGQFQFLTPENEQIQISYVADENGYQPTGNALPTSPPIPIAIQRALEYIAAHPQQPEPSQKRF